MGDDAWENDNGLNYENAEPSSEYSGGFHALSPYLFKDQDEISVPVYYRFNNNFILFRGAGSLWSDKDFAQLRDLGITELFAKTDESKWQTFIENRLERLIADEATGSIEKAKTIYSVSTSTTESFFRNPRSHEAARKVVSLVKHSVTYFTNQKDSFWDLFESANSDLSERTHGLHTAAYAVRLAQQIGENDPHRLSALAIGATLHDIGKTKIDRAILDKEDPLTDYEWEIVRKHPIIGYEMTESFKTLVPDLSRQIILEHHERPDGSGYPYKLKSETHLYSHIVAIADVFDSMTSHRPYKRQSPSKDAMLELLQTQMGKLQSHLLVAFIEMMKK